MVTTGIVGASMPIACGLALAAQLRGETRVTVANFGDGASNIGAFHESLNLAAVWKLPVIFVCQNNQYAEHTSYAKGTSCRSEEHTSELQSLMRISYAVFCLKKKTQTQQKHNKLTNYT